MLYSDYRSDPMRTAKDAVGEAVHHNQSSQAVETKKWNSMDTAVRPQQVLQDSTTTPASILLDDMLERPPRISHGQEIGPGANYSPQQPKRNSLYEVEGAPTDWASRKSTWMMQKLSDEAERDGVKRLPGTWTNGSYLGEAVASKQAVSGNAGSSTSALPGSGTVDTKVKPKVAVPKLWREGVVAFCLVASIK